MKFGSLATVGYATPSNYHHVVFDNGAHDSTGGQPTPSPSVDFAVAALACGYRQAETVSAPDALVDAVARHTEADGPTLLRVMIKTGSRNELGRPTLTPRQCYQRFSHFLSGSRT
jgi:phosphonopyruvate decarboxylase